jgi:hypothetical protein
VLARRFYHRGKAYLAFQGGVPTLPAGTPVATGYAVSVVADGHTPSVDELSATLLAFEGRAQGQQS